MILRYLKAAIDSLRMGALPQTKNFNAEEFRCHDGTRVPRRYYESTQSLMEQLEVLREQLGGPRIHIISGYRSPSHNAKKNGAPKSRHMTGQAADIKVDGYSPKLVADAIVKLIESGRMAQGGVGRYPGFTHYDVRGKQARWGSNG